MRLIVILLIAGVMAACGKKEAPPQARPPAEVSVIKIVAQDTPVSFEYVGQTESSHQVQIVARVNGFLDRRVYKEGLLVKAGEVMFLQDPKPFQASLAAAKGALAQREAQLQTANSNLARVKPLAALNALSQKDLDDAIGSQQAAAADVQTAKADVLTAELNLSYTTITSPVTGISSFARVQDGAYVNPTNSLLTYVSLLDPIWVNFTLSENDLLAYKTDLASGRLRAPPEKAFEVEAVLADGSTFPHTGRITFKDADFNRETGTYLLRATLPNPTYSLRPGQFVRVRVNGNVRPNAILVPQQAVLQGPHGHFVFVVDKDGKAQQRVVKVGDWHGKDWFISEGLQVGEVVVTEGVIKLAPGAPVKIAAAHPAQAPPSPDAATPVSKPVASSDRQPKQ